MSKYVGQMKKLNLTREYRRNTLRHLILEFFSPLRTGGLFLDHGFFGKEKPVYFTLSY